MPAEQKVLTPEEVKALARPIKKETSRKKTTTGRPPLFKEPPRGQVTGPFGDGPKQWIVCTTCTKLFSTKENPVRYGIRPRHAKKHLADHRMGRIKRPAKAKAKK